MRTTVELSPQVHARVKAYAARRGESMACVLGDFAAAGINQVAPVPARVVIDPVSGFPYLDAPFERTLTAEEIAAIIAEDEEAEEW